jgi:hypothetical protein
LANRAASVKERRSAGIKSELRDNQNLAAGTQKRKVHLAFLVFEDTKILDLSTRKSASATSSCRPTLAKMHRPDVISPTMFSPTVTGAFVHPLNDGAYGFLLTQNAYATTEAGSGKD